MSESRAITEADRTAAKLGDSISISAIGEPVRPEAQRATLESAGEEFCCLGSVNGSMAPVDHAASAKPINFQVASKTHDAAIVLIERLYETSPSTTTS